MGKKVSSDRMDDNQVLKFVLRKKVPYSLGLAMFLYFGMIFCLFFACLLLPRLLDPDCRFICFIPTSSEFVYLDSLLFSPWFIPIKLLLVLAITLLPALSCGRGFVLSAVAVSPAAIVVWHFAMASVGLEKLGAKVEDLNVLLAPLGLFDGLLVIVPAFALGTLFSLAGEMTNKDRISLTLALKFTTVPVGLALILSIVQLHLIF